MSATRLSQYHQNGIRTALFVMACMCVPTSALAEPKTTTIVRAKPAPQIDAEVEKLYNEGVAAAAELQWEKARQRFAEAFALDPRPQIAANLGNAELELGKMRDAAEHLDYFLREDKDAEAEARAEVKALFATAALSIVTVDLSVDHDGADLFVNHSHVGKSPLTKRLFLEPDSYIFEAKKDGLKPGSQALDLSRGTSVGVKLVMGEAKSGTVLPNGQMKTTPKGKDWRLPLTIGAGGLALVGIGFGIGLNVVAKNNADASMQGLDELKDQSQTTGAKTPVCEVPDYVARCDELRQKARRADQFVYRSIAGFAVGGLALTGMIVLLAMPKGETKNLRILPVLGHAQTGIALTGAF
jgi:hypothetical protein